MRILIVDSNRQSVDFLVCTLERNKFRPRHAETAESALASFEDAQLILLDPDLPDLDGYHLCRLLRARTDVPVIVLSSRTGELDLVMALHSGADDYVAKPVGRHELLARIGAVSRRACRSIAPAAGRSQHPDPAKDGVLRLGPLRLDTRTRQVMVRDREVQLRRKEFDLLAFLMEEPGTVRTRDEIIAAVWDEKWYGSTHTLNVHIATLRAKLGDPRWIETVRGVGYRVIPSARSDVEDMAHHDHRGAVLG